jgi:capsid protein
MPNKTTARKASPARAGKSAPAAGRRHGFQSRARARRMSAAAESAAPVSLRRFEAAETNRLNRAHWAKVGPEQSINVDLQCDLPTLRARTAFEIARNPILNGVANTFALDVAGEEGPMLQVNSDDEEYDAAAEGFWSEWFKCPEISGKLHGADAISLWTRRLLDCGEYLAQRVNKTRGEVGPVSLRLKLLHPRRLATPPLLNGDADIALGVKRSEDGEPLAYYITQPIQFGGYMVDTGRFNTIRPESIIHEFITIEEDQVRGVPWLATQLQTTADLRDFDHQVLDAARAAADAAVLWFTESPDAEFLDTDATVEIERRVQQTGPPGWKPMQIKPEHPAINHIEYRSDRMRELGRPLGMPLMMVRLGSEEHNFSSARFDNEIYKRGIKAIRKFIERRTLLSLVDDVLREGELYAGSHRNWKFAALARRRRQKLDVHTSFIWSPMIAVDAEKDSQDDGNRLKDGSRTFEQVCGRNGNRQENQIRSFARTFKLFKQYGLPLPAWAQEWGDPLIKQQLALQQAKNSQAPAKGQRGTHAPEKNRRSAAPRDREDHAGDRRRKAARARRAAKAKAQRDQHRRRKRRAADDAQLAELGLAAT